MPARSQRKITVIAQDDQDKVKSLLDYIGQIGNGGHTFTIDVDPETSDTNKKFDWDGDGSDRIISVDSEEMEDEGGDEETPGAGELLAAEESALSIVDCMLAPGRKRKKAKKLEHHDEPDFLHQDIPDWVLQMSVAGLLDNLQSTDPAAYGQVESILTAFSASTDRRDRDALRFAANAHPYGT